jgi:hypothetical protein
MEDSMTEEDRFKSVQMIVESFVRIYQVAQMNAGKHDVDSFKVNLSFMAHDLFVKLEEVRK